MRAAATIALASAISLKSDPNFSSLGSKTRHYKGEGDAPFGEGFPINYAVPNFGQDHDVAHTLNSVAASEKALGHKPNWTAEPAAPHPQDYFVPSFGADPEIAASQASLAQAEKSIGNKWVWKDQTEAGPAAVAPWYALSHGPDDDIAATQNNIAEAQKSLQHKWEIKE